MHVIENETIRLRWLMPEDALWVLRLLNDADFIAQIGDRNVRTLGDAKRYMEQGPLWSCHERGFGLYAIEHKSDHMVVGMCGLVRRATLQAPDVGYALLPEFRGKGMASHAVHLTLQHAKRDLNLPLLLAIITPGNMASQAVLQRNGFACVGNVLLQSNDELVTLFQCAL